MFCPVRDCQGVRWSPRLAWVADAASAKTTTGPGGRGRPRPGWRGWGHQARRPGAGCATSRWSGPFARFAGAGFAGVLAGGSARFPVLSLALMSLRRRPPTYDERHVALAWVMIGWSSNQSPRRPRWRTCVFNGAFQPFGCENPPTGSAGEANHISCKASWRRAGRRGGGRMGGWQWSGCSGAVHMPWGGDGHGAPTVGAALQQVTAAWLCPRECPWPCVTWSWWSRRRSGPPPWLGH